MKKRFFAIILSLVLLISFMPVMASAAPVQGWKKIDGSWYYSDPGKDGKLALGWKKIDGYWYYFAPKDGPSENGQPYHEGEMYGNGADRINGKWYYFGESYNAKKWGKLQYNWVKDTDSYGYVENWYYGDPDKDGQLTQGWKKIGGYWYYFVKEDGSLESDAPENVGAMLDYGPVRINNKLYYFGRSFNEAQWGKLQYKWIKETEIFGKVTFEYWYYADPNKDGQLATGWKKIDGK